MQLTGLNQSDAPQFKAFKEKFHHQKGFVFAYPTEAVYGLGASPFDESAVNRILAIKKRSAHQHFILIASDWSQITSLIQTDALSHKQLSLIQSSWPGPITWVFPASSNTPTWLINHDQTIAIRITAHLIAKTLCTLAGHPLISTSANLSGTPPCRTYSDTHKIFAQEVDLIIQGETDGLAKPTPIRDARTGLFLRT